MAQIVLDHLTKRFGETPAVIDLSLELASGELVALLGPSGCGKTTTLRMVAGFETPTAGRVLLADRDLTDAPPERRNCGMVFQNYALFPHLTVEQNVAFGLEMRAVERAEIRRRVADILGKVGLAGLGGRYPRQLSGGQQQRTALARALVVNPSVLLLDEPLANLDAKLREEMRFYIRSLQREFHITTLYVTHDQAEALVLADRVAILMGGVLQQYGRPEDVYHRPRSAAVAGFIGLTNLIPGRVRTRAAGRVVVDTVLGLVTAAGDPALREGAEVLLSVRPEQLDLVRPGAAPQDGANVLRGTVRERTFLGSLADFRVDVDGGVVLRVQGRPSAMERAGDAVAVAFDAEAAWALPGATS